MRRRLLRGLSLALFVSLLANVFLGSVLVARMLLPVDEEPPKKRFSHSRAWQAMAQDLPEPHRARAVALWQEAIAQREKYRAERKAMRQAANAALLSEPFDAEALRAAFASMRHGSTSRWDGYLEAMLATAPFVPLERRRAHVAASEKHSAERQARRAARDAAR